jgi:GNAT superfamily N-acetyltransferase
MSPDIRQVAAHATLPIRFAILRPGMPPESANFPGDDAPETQHFGAFLEDQMVGVASIYFSPRPGSEASGAEWQLRGMATLPHVRGRGFGRALLHACAGAALARGGTLLWCNARAAAVAFYAMHGWHVISEEFDIPTAGPHFRMVLELC